MEQKSKQSATFISEKTALILIFIVIAISALIMFVDWDGSGSNNRSAISATSRVSQQSLRLSYRHDEFSELVLKPNRTYTIRFLQAGTSGTFYAPAMRRVRIKSPIHHTTIFPDTSFGESGNRGWLGNKKAYERFKIFSTDIQDITITTSG